MRHLSPKMGEVLMEIKTDLVHYLTQLPPFSANLTPHSKFYKNKRNKRWLYTTLSSRLDNLIPLFYILWLSLLVFIVIEIITVRFCCADCCSLPLPPVVLFNFYIFTLCLSNFFFQMAPFFVIFMALLLSVTE